MAFLLGIICLHLFLKEFILLTVGEAQPWEEVTTPSKEGKYFS
jgi:hypothetical protein